MAFKKGNKLGGRRRSADGVDAKQVFEKFIPEAVKTIITLLKSYDDPTRMRAAIHILDRALGKVKESVELTGKDGGPAEIVVSWGTKPDGKG